MFGTEHIPLLERLLGDLNALQEQTTALVKECRFTRRRDPVRGFVIHPAPTVKQRSLATANLQQLSQWQATVLSVLGRRGIAHPELVRALSDLSSLVQLKYLGPSLVPAPRTRAAIGDSVQALALRLVEILNVHAHAFQLPKKRVPLAHDSLVIRIGSCADGQWQVEASFGDDHVMERVEAPFREAELRQFLSKGLDAGQGSSSEAVPRLLESLAAFGGRLFRGVFSRCVADLYKHALIRTIGQGHALRLRFDATHDLAKIPWELMHDEIHFLGMAGSPSIVRGIEGANVTRYETVRSSPLRVLLTVSSPRGLDRIDRENERRMIEQAVAPLIYMNALQLDVTPDGCMKTVGRFLRTARDEGRPYHVWHFAGHGNYDESEGRGTLAMTAPDGAAHWVGALELATLFGDSQIRLVVLSSCHGAEGSPRNHWSVAATSFVLCGIEAVVAMQLDITPRAVTAFGAELYGALSEGASIDQAIAAGRRGILELPNYVEWVRPVLFVRGEEAAPRERGT